MEGVWAGVGEAVEEGVVALGQRVPLLVGCRTDEVIGKSQVD